MGLGHTGQCPGAWVLKTLWFRNRAERAHPPNHAKGGRNRQFPIPQWLRPSRNRYLAPLLLQGRWLFLPTNCDAFWALQTSTTWRVVTIWRWLTPRSPAEESIPILKAAAATAASKASSQAPTKTQTPQAQAAPASGDSSSGEVAQVSIDNLHSPLKS